MLKICMTVPKNPYEELSRPQLHMEAMKFNPSILLGGGGVQGQG